MCVLFVLQRWAVFFIYIYNQPRNKTQHNASFFFVNRYNVFRWPCSVCLFFLVDYDFFLLFLCFFLRFRQYCDIGQCPERAAFEAGNELRCLAHKKPGMKPRRNICQVAGGGCTRQSSYGRDGGKPMVCTVHRERGMVQASSLSSLAGLFGAFHFFFPLFAALLTVLRSAVLCFHVVFCFVPSCVDSCCPSCFLAGACCRRFPVAGQKNILIEHYCC